MWCPFVQQGTPQRNPNYSAYSPAVPANRTAIDSNSSLSSDVITVARNHEEGQPNCREDSATHESNERADMRPKEAGNHARGQQGGARYEIEQAESGGPQVWRGFISDQCGEESLCHPHV